MGHRRGLGHPEPLLEAGCVGGALLHEVADEGGAKGRRAPGDELDGGEVLGLDLLVRGQVAHQRRHQVQQGRLVGDQGLDVEVGVKLGQRDDLHPQPQAHDHDRGHGVNVKEWQHCQRDILTSGLDEGPRIVD